MPRTHVAVVALLALAPALLAGADATVRAEGEPFTPPPFRVGDAANYTTTGGLAKNLTVAAPGTTLDKAARTVPAFAVTELRRGVAVRAEDVGLATFTVESVRDLCLSTAVEEGRCAAPVRQVHWASQGDGALWGATLLQGRAFRVGDAWTQGGECARLCVGNPRVVIEAPYADSPAGTAYVAKVTGGYVCRYTCRLHMGESHAFPLRMGGVGGAWDLAAFAPGATPIAPPAPPAAPTYAPPLPALPFEDGLPVEGAPAWGLPAWSEARNATALLGDPRPAGSTFIGLDYAPPSGPGDVAAQRTIRIEARYAAPGAPDALVTHTRGDVTVGGAQVNGVWRRTTTTDGWTTTPGACIQGSVAFWDAQRHLDGLGLLHERSGHRWDSRWFYEPSCARAVVELRGATWTPPGGVLGYTEHVQMDASTSYLSSALHLEP